MLTFFRKIRKALLDSGSARKYLLYAIGEILLVMIGILLALQVSNWNELRKDRDMELKILDEIKRNLLQDLVDHHQNMGNVQGIVRSSTLILDHLNNNKPYHDSLNFHFGWLPMAANFDPVKSGYELMLSQGVNIIQNDSLRNKISLLYSSQYSWLRSWLKDRQYLDRPPLLEEMIKAFSVLRIYETAIPKDYDSLQSNESFKAAISHYLFCFELTDRFYQPIIDQVEALIKDIDQEIQHLN